MISQICVECGSELMILNDAELGEIIECPDCGIDYVLELDENQSMTLQILNLEGEDWGE